MTSVDNAGTPGAPHVVLTSQFDSQGDRSSLAATINGAADFINSYAFDTLARLDQIEQQGQSGGNAVAQKSIYLGLNGIGDITEIDRSNSVYAGPNQSGPAYSLLTYNSTTGLLTGINHEYMGSSIDNLTYTYDALARVSTFTSIDGTATYGYDHTSQIVSATYTTANGGHQPANISYTWDANGNNAATGNVVSANNEVTNDGTFTYQFDADGNRTVRTRISNSYASDYKTTYSWDYRNRLTDVEFFDNNNVLTKHVHYIYDVYQNLIEEDIDPTGGGTYTTKEQFALDVLPKLPVQVLSLSGAIDASPPADTLLEFVNGALAYRYLNAPGPSGVDVVAAQCTVGSLQNQDVTTWPLVNQQGTETDIVDVNGVLIDHIVDALFGQTVYESNATVYHLQSFSGGTADSNTGLIKFGELWYDPTTGRWPSQNPAGFVAGDTNLYRYVGNSPTDGIDPTGLLTQYTPDVAGRQPTGGMRSDSLASGASTDYAETPVGGSTSTVPNNNSSTAQPMTTVVYAQRGKPSNSPPNQRRAPTPLYRTPWGKVHEMPPTGRGSHRTPLYRTPWGKVYEMPPTGQGPHDYYPRSNQPKQQRKYKLPEGPDPVQDAEKAFHQVPFEGNKTIEDEIDKDVFEQSTCPIPRKPRPQQ